MDFVNSKSDQAVQQANMAAAAKAKLAGARVGGPMNRGQMTYPDRNPNRSTNPERRSEQRALGLRGNMEAGRMSEHARAVSMNPNVATGTPPKPPKTETKNPGFSMKTAAQQRLRLARRAENRATNRAENIEERLSTGN